jgi:hypothetical protein
LKAHLLTMTVAHEQVDHALRQWSSRYFESLGETKDLRIPLRLQDIMRAAGFVDVEQRMLPLPTCAWSSSASYLSISSGVKDDFADDRT